MPRRSSSEPTPRFDKKTEELLQEIRDRYRYYLDAWQPHRDEASIDVRFRLGDPWDDEDKKARKDAGRPCISLDELNQYLNQWCNNLRQHRIGIKVNPAGKGATNKTAEFHEDLIRGIEYRSNAWRSAYIPAAESMAERSYGFFKITRKYVADDSFDQEIRIVGITNPDTILYDPDCKEADWSDAEGCFEVTPLRREEFKRKYPRAKVQDFSPNDAIAAPDWIREDHVVVGAYWKVEKKQRRMMLIDGQAGPTVVYEDELQKGDEPKILKERKVEVRSVIQYITNGVEILETLPQPGPYIPIIPVIGKEIWRTEGGKSTRHLLSMIRLARDPQMLYAYFASQEAEEASQTPLAPIIGAVGQFETDSEAWDTAHKVPHSRLMYDPVVETAGGQQVLPPPTRHPFEPNFQQYEIAKESAKRAIQAAMGISPLPTAAQRRNEKSGVALQQIEQQEQVGSFHFTDNVHRALEFGGRVIESWKKVVYDTEREVPLRKKDDSNSVARINTAEPVTDGGGEPYHYKVGEGDHDITISAGPTSQSQHDEASDFANTIIQNIEALPLDPSVKAKFLSLIIKMRNLGPLGDQMAELLDPSAGSPQQVAAQAAQMQGKLQQATQIMQAMQQELQKLQLEKAGKVIEQQTKLQIAQLDHKLEIAKLDNARVIAEIQTKAQIASERASQLQEVELELHGAAHEIAMQKDQQAHEQELAQQAAAQQSAQQATQIQADQQTAAARPEGT